MNRHTRRRAAALGISLVVPGKEREDPNQVACAATQAAMAAAPGYAVTVLLHSTDGDHFMGTSYDRERLPALWKALAGPPPRAPMPRRR